MRKRTLKKSIAIVGEGLTEWMYFDYIRRSEDILFLLNQTYPSIRIFNTSSKKQKNYIHKRMIWYFAFSILMPYFEKENSAHSRKFVIHYLKQ